MPILTDSKIVSKALSPALKLWLKTQVELIEGLKIEIAGADRQIMRGYIPSIFLAVTRAIYRGLHVGKVKLTGENIRINLGQVIKGKPLCLLEPVLVTGNLVVEEADLNASLESSILKNGLTDLFFTLLQANGITHPQILLKEYQLNWQRVSINLDTFSLTANLIDRNGKIAYIAIRSGLDLLDSQKLILEPIEVDGLANLIDLTFCKSLTVDLGDRVELEQLILSSGQLKCSGKIVVVS